MRAEVLPVGGTARTGHAGAGASAAEVAPPQRARRAGIARAVDQQQPLEELLDAAARARDHAAQRVAADRHAERACGRTSPGGACPRIATGRDPGAEGPEARLNRWGTGQATGRTGTAPVRECAWASATGSCWSSTARRCWSAPGRSARTITPSSTAAASRSTGRTGRPPLRAGRQGGLRAAARPRRADGGDVQIVAAVATVEAAGATSGDFPVDVGRAILPVSFRSR